jgi:hypothetical protein
VFGPFSPGYRLAVYVYITCIGLHYTGVRVFDILAIGTTTSFIMMLAAAWRAPRVLLAPVLALTDVLQAM